MSCVCPIYSARDFAVVSLGVMNESICEDVIDKKKDKRAHQCSC
jgi:hypothetical protein